VDALRLAEMAPESSTDDLILEPQATRDKQEDVEDQELKEGKNLGDTGVRGSLSNDNGVAIGSSTHTSEHCS